MEKIRTTFLREYLRISLIFAVFVVGIIAALYNNEQSQNEQKRLDDLRGCVHRITQHLETEFLALDVMRKRVVSVKGASQQQAVYEISKILSEDFVDHKVNQSDAYVISLTPLEIIAKSGKVHSALPFTELLNHLNFYPSQNLLFLANEDLYLVRLIKANCYILLKIPVNALLGNQNKWCLIKESMLPRKAMGLAGFLPTPLNLNKKTFDRYARLKNTGLVLLGRAEGSKPIKLFFEQYFTLFTLTFCMGIFLLGYLCMRQYRLKKYMNSQFQGRLDTYKENLNDYYLENKQLRTENEKLHDVQSYARHKLNFMKQLNLRLKKLEQETLEISKILLRDLAQLSKSRLDQSQQVRLLSKIHENSCNILSGTCEATDLQEISLMELIDKSINLSLPDLMGKDIHIDAKSLVENVLVYIDPVLFMCFMTNLIQRSLDRMPKASTLKISVMDEPLSQEAAFLVCIEDCGYVLQDLGLELHQEDTVSEAIDVLNLPWESLQIIAKKLDIKLSQEQPEEAKNITKLYIPIKVPERKGLNLTNVVNIFSKTAAQ